MPTSTPASSERQSVYSSEAGFTLVELALVILILGVLLSLALPRLSLLGEERLDSDARRLAVLISYLHDEAALRGRVYRITLDLDRERYTVEVQRPYAKDASKRDFAEEWDPYARSTSLSDGIEIASVATATARMSSGTTSLYFMPENDLAAVTIVLVESDGESVSLSVDAVTGRVQTTRAANPDPYP